MALTRARPIYGSPAARAALEGLVHAILKAPRDPARLRADVLEMRTTMAGHKPPKGPLDVKLARGGLVDLEFLVHFLQLREGTVLLPDLGEAVRGLVAKGLLPEELVAAHDELTRFLVAARLLAPDAAIPPGAARAALARACGYGNWDAVRAGLLAARHTVARAWCAAFEETLEIPS